MGAGKKDALCVDSDGQVRLEFHGAKVTSDAGLLAYQELDEAVGLTTEVEALIVLTSVRYYDSRGQEVRSHLDRPIRLKPLSAVEFLVDSEEEDLRNRHFARLNARQTQRNETSAIHLDILTHLKRINAVSLTLHTQFSKQQVSQCLNESSSALCQYSHLIFQCSTFILRGFGR